MFPFHSVYTCKTSTQNTRGNRTKTRGSRCPHTILLPVLCPCGRYSCYTESTSPEGLGGTTSRVTAPDLHQSPALLLTEDIGVTTSRAIPSQHCPWEVSPGCAAIGSTQQPWGCSGAGLGKAPSPAVPLIWPLGPRCDLLSASI